jgi:hypothetical protein
MCVLCGYHSTREKTNSYGQHGQPLQIIDICETAIDEQLLEEYLLEMREHYTADKVCHNF